MVAMPVIADGEPPHNPPTAVSAGDAFDDLFEFIDRMTMLELYNFRLKLLYYMLGKAAALENA